MEFDLLNKQTNLINHKQRQPSPQSNAAFPSQRRIRRLPYVRTRHFVLDGETHFGIESYRNGKSLNPRSYVMQPLNSLTKK